METENRKSLTKAIGKWTMKGKWRDTLYNDNGVNLNQHKSMIHRYPFIGPSD